MTRTIALGTLLIGGMLLTAGCDLSTLMVPTPGPTDAAASIPASPTPLPSPSFVRPTPTPLPTFLVYEVRRGDTLSSIAAGFGTTAQSVAYWNRAMYPSLDPDSRRYDPNTIQVGWALRLIPNAEVDPEDLPPARTPSPPRRQHLAESVMTATRSSPRIVVTVAVAAAQTDPDLAARKNALYADAVARHGATPIVLDADSTSAEREAAFEAMEGLLLSGGADIDPARYGQPLAGSVDIETDRDSLEAAAWSAALARVVPVLGLCRGLQAINVFSGGSLLQHVPGHVGSAWGRGPAAVHPIRLVPSTRLASIVAEPGSLEVNSYHHQGIRRQDLARGLAPSAWADSEAGPLVEGLEATDGRFIVGVQCHPERLDSTPPAFERLFEAFVAACRAGSRVRG